MASTVNIRDINPLEHITSDLAKTRFNYESILNGLVAWNASDSKTVTVRLATDTDPGFVDYTFPTRKAYANDYSLFISYDTASPGCFDVDDRITLPVTPGGNAQFSDEAILRLSVSDSRGYLWKLYGDVAIHAEDDIAHASRAYSAGDYFKNDGDVYIVTSAVAKDDSLASMPQQVLTQWQANIQYPKGTVALYGNQDSSRTAYLLVGSNGRDNPQRSNEWEELGPYLNDLAVGEQVRHGQAYVYTDGSGNSAVYIYRGATKALTSAGPYPNTGITDSLADNPWYGPVALVPVSTVEESTVVRYTPETDLRGFIMRCVTTGYGYGSVYVKANVSYRLPPAEAHKGLKVFDTANYALWPDSGATVWQEGRVYGYEDDYAAKMVFHFSDAATKVTNIVNYDGPDLDRGLCIYLPENDNVDGGDTVSPKDGAIIEFMFRIWPNTKLNGRESADLIVNKAQIYVYSLPSTDNLAGGKVIAKFSMARVTNFYVWAENVAIPNRPVFYKAKFIYSATHGEWKTYDYYQIPDHVFLAPKGFVDPSLRLYAEDGTYTGLETAGFPLMQDPFGGMDLTRIRLNRIEEDEPVVEPSEEPAEEPPGE